MFFNMLPNTINLDEQINIQFPLGCSDFNLRPVEYSVFFL